VSYAPRVGGSSLWGKIQHVEKLAEGAWSVSTAGHGGIKLSRGRMAKLPKAARATGFSRSGWFEEDCDWAIPAYAFEDIRDALGVTEDQAKGTLTRLSYADPILEAFGL